MVPSLQMIIASKSAGSGSSLMAAESDEAETGNPAVTLALVACAEDPG